MVTNRGISFLLTIGERPLLCCQNAVDSVFFRMHVGVTSTQARNYKARQGPRCRKCVNQLTSRLECEVSENFIGPAPGICIRQSAFRSYFGHCTHLLSFHEAGLGVVRVDWLQGQFSFIPAVKEL
jgi:hypothetical protein